MEPFIGQILMVGFNFAPQGWALCNGQLLPIQQYAALFSLLGTAYGGDGIHTFGLPNLQGRVAIHQGQGPGLSPHQMGQMGGAENITLMNQNMPMHTHLANCNSGPGTSTAPNGNVWAECGKPPAASAAYAPAANAQMAPTAIGMAGGNVPVAILPPYLCVNFIIATVGIFPTRD